VSENLPALITFAAVMSITPGPNNVMVTASGANFGLRRSWPHIFGITIGFALMIAILGFGVAGLFRAVPQIHIALKVVGTAYLLWLAWRIATADRTRIEGGGARPLTFLEAAAFQWLNPKGWVFAAGALSTFTTAGGNVIVEVTAITGVIAVACIAAVIAWCAFGVAIGRLLRSDRALAAFNWSMAALLTASIVASWL
jgi:threonine/homoserine/homoserine lactone efflux protein